jgi:hypothetical protein
MPDIPRRLPPTPEERLSVVVSRMAGGSSAGVTRWARPLSGSAYRATDALATSDDEQPPATSSGITTVALNDQYVYPDDPQGFRKLTVPLVGSTRYLVEHFVWADVEPGGQLDASTIVPFGSVQSPQASVWYRDEQPQNGRVYPEGVVIDYAVFHVIAAQDGDLVQSYQNTNAGLLALYSAYLRVTVTGTTDDA